MAQLALSCAHDEGIPARAVHFAEAIPRALGLDVCELTKAQPDRGGAIAAALNDMPDRDAGTEVRIGRAGLALNRIKARSTVPKTSLRMGWPEGEVRVTASDGKVELWLK